MSKIQIKNLSKSFYNESGPHEVLKDISLTVEAGEFVCIVGPNACGKTTLLNIIAGLIDYDVGEVVVDKEKVREPNFNRTMVFQDFNLFFWKTVQGNVEFGLKAKGFSRQERRETAKRYIDLVGLNDYANKYPHQLSGGLKQRTAIARALAVEPEVILMDEPFGSMDSQTREFLQEEITSIWAKTKRTILFVTHSIDEAVFLASRIVVMTHLPGRIKEIMPVEIPRPRSPGVRTSSQFQELRSYLWRGVRSQINKSKLGATNKKGVTS